MLIDPEANRRTRVRCKIQDDGTKVRIAKSGAVIAKQE